jgi:hypothetical protein
VSDIFRARQHSRLLQELCAIFVANTQQNRQFSADLLFNAVFIHRDGSRLQIDTIKDLPKTE